MEGETRFCCFLACFFVFWFDSRLQQEYHLLPGPVSLVAHASLRKAATPAFTSSLTSANPAFSTLFVNIPYRGCTEINAPRTTAA